MSTVPISPTLSGVLAAFSGGEGSYPYVTDDGQLTDFYSGQYIAPPPMPDNPDNMTTVFSAQTQAEQDAIAQQNAFRDSFNQSKDSALTGFQTSTGAFRDNSRNSILDFMDSIRNQQQGVDNSRINAQLGKSQGTASILDTIGRGIRSSGVMLANKNAADSSAAGAIARAYGEYGRNAQSDVNNQFALENRGIQQQQDALNTSTESNKRRFQTEKNNFVNSIVAELQQTFAALNEAAAGAGISDRIQIEQEKEAARQQALSQLAELDTMLGQQVNPMDQNQIIGQANQLSTQGQVGSNYGIDQVGPLTTSGADLSQLPLYSSRRNRKV